MQAKWMTFVPEKMFTFAAPSRNFREGIFSYAVGLSCKLWLNEL